VALVESVVLPLGWEAVDFKLKGVDEKEYSLSDFKDKKGLLLVFTCNHCPYAQAAWPLLVGLYKKFGGEVGLVGINANDPINYPDDSFEKMKELVKEYGVEFPYLVDESQEVARKYKAQCTPDPYLFRNENGVFKLFYHGRINDNWQKQEKVKEKSLEEAISKVVKGEEGPERQMPSMGCSIKWKS